MGNAEKWLNQQGRAKHQPRSVDTLTHYRAQKLKSSQASSTFANMHCLHYSVLLGDLLGVVGPRLITKVSKILAFPGKRQMSKPLGSANHIARGNLIILSLPTTPLSSSQGCGCISSMNKPLQDLRGSVGDLFVGFTSWLDAA